METESISTLLQSNLAALAPVTKRVLEAASADGVVQIHVANGVLSASLRTKDGRSVRVHSGRDPVGEAERFVERAIGSIAGGAPPVIILIGPGLGYVLEAIERRAPATKVIALEPFPAMARAMFERRDWREWIESKRLTVLVGPDFLGASDAGRTLDEGSAASAAIVEHPVVTREFPEETARAHAAAAQLLKGAQLNAQARRAFAGRYLLNTLRNTPLIAAEADVADLRGAFAGVPAVVVAAGPSLDHALHELRDLQDRVLIVSVDTALRPLRAAGIRPHLVVAVDPSELNARHMLGLLETEGSWLVSEGAMDSRILPEFPGRAFTFKVSNHQPWPWLAEHDIDRGSLRAWGSVLTTAFDLACYVGCDPIVFVGADLSYPDGLHYCRGTTHEVVEFHHESTEARAEMFAEATRHHKRVVIDEPDIHGAPVASTPPFVQFRDWLVSRAAEAKPTRVINATGAGILYGGGITPGTLAMLRSLSLPDEQEGIAARLASLWAESAPERAKALNELTGLLEEAERGRLPLDTWLEFGGDTASADDIMACVEMTWRQAPAIAAQPSDVLWTPGGHAHFRIDAQGGPPPAIQWQLAGEDGNWSDVVGATSRTYEFEMERPRRHWRVRARLTNRYGTAVSASAGILPASISGLVHDFNGDGRPDILWRSTDRGANVVWFMDGAKRTGIGVLTSVRDLGWDLVAAGDFTGDGKPDLFWRNSLNGLTSIWIMDGVAGRKQYGPSEPETDLAWVVAGTVDFNADGRSEVLWRHSISGAVMLWDVEGMQRRDVSALDSEPDLDWAIVGAGDFNGDGRPDILWRHRVTGANRVWLMDGLSRVGTVMLEPEPDGDWTVVGTGDFDGDGKTDILWRHVVTDEILVWYMDGARRVRVGALSAADHCSWQYCAEALRTGAL